MWSPSSITYRILQLRLLQPLTGEQKFLSSYSDTHILSITVGAPETRNTKSEATIGLPHQLPD